MEERLISVRIVCQELPDPQWGGQSEIWLGVQKGKEVVQSVKLPADEVAFDIELRAVLVPDSDRPNFLGPYSQGTPQERFFYLCWGRQTPLGWSGFRRAKIPLGHLTWNDLDGDRVTVTIKCTDAKGGPACATLRGDYVQWG